VKVCSFIAVHFPTCSKPDANIISKKKIDKTALQMTALCFYGLELPMFLENVWYNLKENKKKLFIH